jgi:hypothetical protein
VGARFHLFVSSSQEGLGREITLSFRLQICAGAHICFTKAVDRQRGSKFAERVSMSKMLMEGLNIVF